MRELWFLCSCVHRLFASCRAQLVGSSVWLFQMRSMLLTLTWDQSRQLQSRRLGESSLPPFWCNVAHMTVIVCHHFWNGGRKTLRPSVCCKFYFIWRWLFFSWFVPCNVGCLSMCAKYKHLKTICAQTFWPSSSCFQFIISVLVIISHEDDSL